MTHITCRLTVKYRDQLQHPMLGNRVLATFTFITYLDYMLALMTCQLVSVDRITQIFMGFRRTT